VFVVGDVPHAWLFPRVAAVVHHGGAGTTAEALRAGVPQWIVPFLADQPFWGRLVHRAGIGPAPVSIDALTGDDVRAALTTLADPGTCARAAAIAEADRTAPGAEAAVVAIEKVAAAAG
jgi:UDP:flavonoid glycosyltransferase YjiC (YdhE family)